MRYIVEHFKIFLGLSIFEKRASFLRRLEVVFFFIIIILCVKYFSLLEVECSEIVLIRVVLLIHGMLMYYDI